MTMAKNVGLALLAFVVFIITLPLLALSIGIGNSVLGIVGIILLAFFVIWIPVSIIWVIAEGIYGWLRRLKEPYWPYSPPEPIETRHPADIAWEDEGKD